MSQHPNNNITNPYSPRLDSIDNNLFDRHFQDSLTPRKIDEHLRRDEVFHLMTPLPLPPKISSQHSASTQAYNAFSSDMKVIQTPYIHHNPIFRGTDIQDMPDDLRPITSKIQWQKTPGKSQPSSSEYEADSESEGNSSVIPQQHSQKQGSSPQQVSQSQNQQKKSINIQDHSIALRAQKQRIKRSPSTKKQLSQVSVPGPNTSNKKVFCNCKKTKCLKLYCDCFRINQTCDGCNCMGCHNLQEYAQQRNNAILVLMDRNPDPFSQKIQADKHVKGCNCKKSYCQKKYCECYQAGLICGDNCKCDECKNGGGSQKREKYRLQQQMLNNKKQESQ